MTGKPHDAFVVGLAASLGAGISMGLAEALSNDGEISGRGSPLITGNVTGVGTAIGGMGHTFPFLLPKLSAALTLAYIVVVVELLSIAYIRFRYMHAPLGRTIAQVIGGGAIVFAVGLLLGRFGAGGELKPVRASPQDQARLSPTGNTSPAARRRSSSTNAASGS